MSGAAGGQVTTPPMRASKANVVRHGAGPAKAVCKACEFNLDCWHRSLASAPIVPGAATTGSRVKNPKHPAYPAGAGSVSEPTKVTPLWLLLLSDTNG